MVKTQKLATEKDSEKRFFNFDLKMSCAVIGFAAIYRIGGEVSSFYILLLFVDLWLL